MFRTFLRAGFVPAALGFLAALGASTLADLRVQPDEENIPSGRLAGTWVVDTTLCERLGSGPGPDEIEFRVDGSVLAAVPQELAEKLKRFRIYEAGLMTSRAAVENAPDQVLTGPYLLVENAGNPHLVWLRERDGEPLADAESASIVVIPAAEKRNEIFLMGGDFDNQPFRAWRRKSE